MTDRPGPLLDANFRWITTEGKPTPELYQYFRAFDSVMRTVIGIVDTPDNPLPLDYRNEYMEVACSDEVVPLEVGTAVVTFRMIAAMEGQEVRASLKTEQTSGSALTVDIKKGGASILSTPITIDNGSRTSVGATTPAVISDTDWTDDAEMTVDITQVGDGTAIGLKIVLIGNRPAP